MVNKRSARFPTLARDTMAVSINWKICGQLGVWSAVCLARQKSDMMPMIEMPRPIAALL